MMVSSATMWTRLRPLTIGFAASLVTIVIFSPRLVIWRAWWLAADAFYGPEVGRASSVLWQVDHLGSPIPDDIHEIIRWRLLFPAIARFLQLPALLHLGLYASGGLVTAVYVSRLLCGRNIPSWAATAAVLAFVTNAWFFTSTGWLGYADAWVVLGLLAMAFSQRLDIALLAGLLIPWCDDRFVLAAPLALAVRTVLPPTDTALLQRESAKQLFLLAIGPSLYVLIRGLLEVFPSTRSAQGYGFPPIQGQELVYAWGVWETWRCAWLAAVVACVMAYRRSHIPSQTLQRVAASGMILLALTIFLLAVFTAYDVTRAGVTIAPLIAAGIRTLTATAPGRRWLLVIAVGNLLLPATHIVINVHVPIRSLPTEVYLLHDPPSRYDGASYAKAAVGFASQGEWTRAERNLAIARRLSPDNTDVVIACALLPLMRGDSETACALLSRALLRNPEHRGGIVALAELLHDNGHVERARAVAAIATHDLPRHDPLVRQLQPILH